MKKNFIIIDDDSINNMLITYKIKKVVPEAEVYCYTNPVEGLAFIKSIVPQNTDSLCVLLLDINMPEINGWEIMDEFAKLPEEIKNHFLIYIVSSSIDPGDQYKANLNPLVQKFLTKPVLENVIELINNTQVNTTKPNVS